MEHKKLFHCYTKGNKQSNKTINTHRQQCIRTYRMIHTKNKHTHSRR